VKELSALARKQKEKELAEKNGEEQKALPRIGTTQDLLGKMQREAGVGEASRFSTISEGAQEKGGLLDHRSSNVGISTSPSSFNRRHSLEPIAMEKINGLADEFQKMNSKLDHLAEQLKQFWKSSSNAAI
jgi:hypothetical protein